MRQPHAGYALAALVLFVVEVLIARYVDDSFIRPYLGDALVVVLIYCVLRAATPLRTVAAVAVALGLACAVELSQGFDLVGRLGLASSGFARALLGTHFDPRDFAMYALGALLVLLIERLRR